MMINVWTKEGSNVFFNMCEVVRIAFEKDETLKQSERAVKVVFKNGDKGTYICHRDTEKALASANCKCACTEE